ncbi:MAG: LysM peptidoglycan-binding domain-containing protein [Chloroflexota bacterium]|nr:LysM peptidoglycan-binding domain-containing protein [Chloroflexota bacterium]
MSSAKLFDLISSLRSRSLTTNPSPARRGESDSLSLWERAGVRAGERAGVREGREHTANNRFIANKIVNQLRFVLFLGMMLILSVGGTACTPEPIEATPTPGIPPQLSLYYTSTFTPTTNPDAGATDLTPTLLDTPTATPVIYEIQSGDTLLAVAQQHNLSLDKLLAANPGIDPNFLIVGDEIIIPPGDSSLAAYPVPTPLAVNLDSPQCYPTADGGLWCLALVENSQAQAMENISALISLYSPEGERVAQQSAISPLNVLPAGESIPLSVFFLPPLPSELSPRIELQTALPVPPDSDRYLAMDVHIEDVNLYQDSASVQGQITIVAADNAPSAHHIWLAVIAYNVDGAPVGLRKWENETELAAGDSLDFGIIVYSLGPTIAEVKVLGEARP